MQDELRSAEQKQLKKEARHELRKRQQEELELKHREEEVEELMMDDLTGDTGQGQGAGQEVIGQGATGQGQEVTVQEQMRQVEALLGGGSVGQSILDR